MSVTAPQRLRGERRRTRASGRRRPTSRSSARSRPPSAPAMFTRNRVQAAPVRVSQRAPRARRAAGGRRQLRRRERRHRRARRARRAARRPRRRRALLGLQPEQVARPLDRRDRRAAADGRSSSPASRRPPERSRPRAATPPPRAILTTDTKSKTGRRRGDGFTVGGMAKGAGMIHPVPRDDARRRHDRLPARAPARRSRSCARPSTTSFNRISVDGECSTNDAVVLLANGASGVERTRLSMTTRSRRRSARCAQTSPGRSSTTARARRSLARDRRLRRRRRGRGARDRTRGSRPRRSSRPPPSAAIANWGRVLAAAGSAPWNGGFAHLDPDRLTLSFDGTAVFAAGAPTGAEPELARRGLPDRARPRPRRRGRGVPLLRPLLRLRAAQRGVPT